MASADQERLLNQIGLLLAKQANYSPVLTLLYARLNMNRVGSDIFIESDDHVEYLWSSESLVYPLLDLWEAEKPARRWAEMEYSLQNGKFTVTFIYPGQFDPEEDLFERRQRMLVRYFGDKTVIYPPPLSGDDGQQFDL